MDQSRMVKEAKEMISEDRTPKNIRNLRGSFAFILIVLSILYILDYLLKSSYHSEIENWLHFTISTYERAKLIPEMRFYNSKLELLAK